jgi:single-strand DNA-binding protein
MNTINLTGRLTRDPELIQLSDGKTVCKLRLAVDRMGRANEVGYIDVAEFGASGEATARTLSQGWLVAVEGRITFNQWQTKDGEKRSGHSVVGHVEFLAAPKGAPADDIEF